MLHFLFVVVVWPFLGTTFFLALGPAELPWAAAVCFLAEPWAAFFVTDELFACSAAA